MIKQISKKLPKTEQKALINRGLRRVLQTDVKKHLKEVILFGSAIDYELTELSDIDMCVIVKNGVDIKIVKKILFNAPREADDKIPYDLLILEEGVYLKKCETGGVCEIIKKEGRSIYLSNSP